MVAIARLEALPPDIAGLAAAARAEDLRLVDRLVGDFQSGANRFNRAGEAIWEARSGAELIGICGLNRDPFARPDEHAGRVRRLYVHAQWRRRGVGSLLLDAVEAEARRHHDILTAFTVDADVEAFYLARGYQPVVGVDKRSVLLRF